MQAPPLRLFPHSRTKVQKTSNNTKNRKFFLSLKLIVDSLEAALYYGVESFSIQKISFLRFISPPLPLYCCKAHEHWA